MDFVQYMAKRALGRIGRPHPNIRHQATCGCGRRLVNIYFRDGEGWKCRKCWEIEDGGEDHES